MVKHFAPNYFSTFIFYCMYFTPIVVEVSSVYSYTECEKICVIVYVGIPGLLGYLQRLTLAIYSGSCYERNDRNPPRVFVYFPVVLGGALIDELRPRVFIYLSAIFPNLPISSQMRKTNFALVLITNCVI